MDKNTKILLGFGAGLALLIGIEYYNKKKKPTGAKFTGTNKSYLDTLHPKYKSLFERFVKHLQDIGYKVQINSAYRDFAKQAKLKKQDKRNASAGFSPHNYGMAIDLQMKSGSGKVYGMNTPTAEWEKTGVPKLAKSMGLDWGGYFKGYPDRVHFVVSGIDTTKLQKIALKQFNTSDPTKIIGNRVMLAQRARKRSCGCMGEQHYCYLN